jgi:CheY-like chemotaxis protein
VELPLASLDAPVGIPLRVPSGVHLGASQPGIARLDGVRVLLVDDDRDAVGVTEAILAGAGAEVRSCLGAVDVPEILRQWRPDVLVSDIEMPGEDGYSLIQKVRSLTPEEGGRTPAVALTAYGRLQDRQRALAAGYSMHVPKPVDPGEFTAIIAGILARPAPA